MRPRRFLLAATCVGLLASVALVPPAFAGPVPPALAFVRSDGTTQHLVTNDGTSETTYTAPVNPTDVRWTSDGLHIVVVEGFPAALDVFGVGSLERSFAPAFQPVLSPTADEATFATGPDCPSRTTTCDLNLVSVDGALRVDLGASDTAAVGWSPDGSRLAYEHHGSSGPEIWSAKADGTDARFVTSAAAGATSIVWLANNELVFVDQTSLGPGIWTFHPGDASATNTGLGPFGDTTTVTRSPDGTRYSLVSSGSGSPDNTDIFGLDGTELIHRGGEKIGTGVGVGGTGPGHIWSPDSKEILLSTCVDLSSFGDVGPCKLILLDVATNTERLLMAGPDEIQLRQNALFGGASFTPDGSRVVASYRNADTGKLQLYVFRTDGSGVTPLPDELGDIDTLPAVRPDVPGGPAKLAPDGGFEGDIGTAWRGLHERGGTSTFTTSTVDPAGGSQAGEITSADDSTSLARYLSTMIPVDGGAAYRFTAFLRATAIAGEGRIDVTFWDASGRYIPDSAASSVDAGESVSGTTGWTQVGISTFAPSAAVTARLEIRLYGTGTLFVDDASFTATPG